MFSLLTMLSHDKDYISTSVCHPSVLSVCCHTLHFGPRGQKVGNENIIFIAGLAGGENVSFSPPVRAANWWWKKFKTMKKNCWTDKKNPSNHHPISYSEYNNHNFSCPYAKYVQWFELMTSWVTWGPFPLNTITYE